MKQKINWDHMTSANSRTFGEELLTEEIELVKQGMRRTTLMMLDVDHFKEFNDTYGHEFGDRVLREVVTTIRSVTRSSDYIVRWGGDEFVGIYRGLRGENITLLLEQIQEAIRKKEITYNDEKIQITVSIGMTEIKSSDQDFKEAVQRADDALYISKKQGRNQGTIV